LHVPQAQGRLIRRGAGPSVYPEVMARIARLDAS
jgi:hypothetical protein